jgi:hypothetical protein
MTTDQSASFRGRNGNPTSARRQWGTVREDYSEGGDAWNYFTHDQARFGSIPAVYRPELALRCSPPCKGLQPAIVFPAVNWIGYQLKAFRIYDQRSYRMQILRAAVPRSWAPIPSSISL